MKKVLFLLLLACGFASSAQAQILRADELEKYAKERYGKKWQEAADSLGSTLALDKNNALTFVQVIDCAGKNQKELYVLLNYWFTSTFNDANSSITLNDKELGTIIAKGYVENIAQHTGGMNHYNVSIEPIIKVDIKDEKIRVTYSLPYYSVAKAEGGGIMGAVTSGLTRQPTKVIHVDEKWVLDGCYPFAKKDSHKKTSCKALVMGHAYSNVVMDKIEECVKNGLVGNENDDW